MPTRVRRIHNFFILICFIFACFDIFANTIYSHNSLHIRFEIFAQSRIQIFDLMHNKCMSKRIFASERIFASNFLMLANIRNNCFEANIHKTSSEIHIQVNISLQILAYKRIFACKYSHTSEYLLSIALNYIRIL